MQVLHLTPNKPYELVKLIANRVSKTNQLALIEIDNERYMTGGLLLVDNPEIRKILDATPKEKQYGLVLMFKQNPFVKLYAE